MDSKKIQMPREVHIGPDVLEQTGSICKDLRIDGDILVVSGKNTLKIGGKKAIDSLEKENYSVDSVQITEATKQSIEKVDRKLDNISLIIGVGGGKVIDVAKMASTNRDIYFISAPTAASHDGIVSPLASIKDPQGSYSLKAQSPIGVIADTNIIRNAPFKLLVSGCADIVSNYTAVKDWKLAKRLQNENYSESAAALSLMTAKLMITSADAIKPRLEESARLVVKSLFSSGMAISIAGTSRPASGSEHKFSHALDKIAPQPALHGEQCGVGSILMMCLQGGDWEFIRDALKKIKAPTTSKELKIKPEYIIKALTMAHTIRKERYTILGDRGLSKSAAENLAIKTEVI
ncbi:NAD(P)-dependent glycerol-1-phosphate dehydrogenase [Methanobrevibacter filiformis]|uniref:Glycerol-1-phosphate dehydrogenase [NAD(P)+] n=1 Tax=Methanobrevibacter filiformis TaxID=55758 RepID=A0A165Z9U2_9EURY|nr:NAD(P)-dependent glycerol-1-phosphate dehydrogenase [Methanobrevibacter filiformis]KZX10448.1 glycerol-1-phosphate dehydrogenase [Methanobrevibacter filiformis]